MDEAEYDRVALMYRAKLIALDTPDAGAPWLVRSDHEPTMEDAFIGAHRARRHEENAA